MIEITKQYDTIRYDSRV